MKIWKRSSLSFNVSHKEKTVKTFRKQNFIENSSRLEKNIVSAKTKFKKTYF